MRWPAAIVDFRDADDDPSPGGAESAAYQAAGLGHGPKNGPFETITELDQVLGMTVTLLNRLRAVVTVHARQPGIDPAHAPRELLVGASTVDGAAAPTPAGVRVSPVPSEFRTSSRGRAYRVIVRTEAAHGGRFARESVIEPARTAPLGFWIREWTVAAATIAPDHALPAGPQPCLLVLP